MSVLISDDFQSYTPDDPLPAPWDTAGDWTVRASAGSQWVEVDGFTSLYTAFRDAGATDHTASIDIQFSGDYLGVMGRVADHENFYLFFFNGTSWEWELWKYVAAEWVLLTSVEALIGDLAGTNMKISCIGSVIKGYSDDVEVISTTDTTFTTGTNVGLYSEGYGELDNFLVEGEEAAPAGNSAAFFAFL